MVQLHLWRFQSTAVWEESAKSFTRVRHNCYLKRETFHSELQVIGFEQKFCFRLLKSSLLCIPLLGNILVRGNSVCNLPISSE